MPGEHGAGWRHGPRRTPRAGWGSQVESLLLTLDGVMMVLVIYMGMRDDRRPPGTPLKSLFRMTEAGTRPMDGAAEERRRLIARSRT